MARPHYHEDHVNHEAWAIPYGDLVTLLLAFFVVMYAISSVNEGKYRAVSDALSSAFGGSPRSVTPIQLGQTQLRGSSFDRPSLQTPDARSGPTSAHRVNDRRVRQTLDMPTLGPEQRETGAPGSAAATKAVQIEVEGRKTSQLQALSQRIQDALAELMRRKLVTVRRGSTFLEVEIQSDILFASGVAQPSPLAVTTVRQLAQVLRAEPNAVRVEGYTDDRPIRTAQFPSNWELSAARAGSVVHELIDAGVDPGRLAVVGYGEHQPVADNATVEGRNANRRVMLVILAMPQGPDVEPERTTQAIAHALGNEPATSTTTRSLPAPAAGSATAVRATAGVEEADTDAVGVAKSAAPSIAPPAGAG